MVEAAQLHVKALGECRIESPLGALVVSSRNQVDPEGDLWMSVLEATGQPPTFDAGVRHPAAAA
jgi:hypothetical protein